MTPIELYEIQSFIRRNLQHFEQISSAWYKDSTFSESNRDYFEAALNYFNNGENWQNSFICQQLNKLGWSSKNANEPDRPVQNSKVS